MEENQQLYGYTLDEIDELAAELFQLLSEEYVPIKLGILALCRAITMIGSEEDMDLACLMIDRLKEMTNDEVVDLGSLEEEEDEDAEI